jgi:putative glutamine amidotransferase
VVPGSALAAITKAAGFEVNSLHSQGIDRLADGLVAEAHAPDGTIEAVRVTDARAFALGVQWHPEWEFWNNPVSQAILGAFGDAIRARSQSKDQS